jgi:hypothetical protein
MQIMDSFLRIMKLTGLIDNKIEIKINLLAGSFISMTLKKRKRLI